MRKHKSGFLHSKLYISQEILENCWKLKVVMRKLNKQKYNDAY